MGISQKTIKILFIKSGGICAFPQCENPLIYPDPNDTIIAEICHIISPKKKSPRYDSSFSKDKLDEIDNLILLCANHHVLVDKEASKYTPGVLSEIKKNHEDNVKKRMELGKPWDCDITDLYYINIPRIATLSAINGIRFDNNLIEIKYLNLLGLELNKVTSDVIKLINVIKPKVLSIEEVNFLNSSLIGLSISINDNFRTKNMPYLHDYKDGRFSITGKLSKDPLIYKKYRSFKLIISIDPRWITTVTAFGTFVSGWIKVSGVCIVKHINKNNRIITATPLILGIPKSPFDAFF